MIQKRKVTMYTLADETGLSIATISRAFDPHSRMKPEKRQLVLDTAKRLGYVQNKMAARLSQETVRIGVLIYGSIRNYYTGYVEGIRDAHAEYADYKVDCDLRVLDRTEHPAEEAYAVLDAFIETGCRGAIVSGLSSAWHANALNRLADVGIPFILLDSDAPGSRRAGVSMNDSLTAGAMAAELLGMAMDIRPVHSRRAAVLRVSKNNITQVQRSEAFKEAATRYGIESVRIFDTENLPGQAEIIMNRILDEEPALGGIYVSSANSVPVCRMVREFGLKMALVTSDVFDALNEYILDGTVFATLWQDPFSQARRAFEAMYAHLAEGQEIPEFIESRSQVVMRSNLHYFTK